MSSTPFTVKAVFEYTSDHEDDLTFSIGQIITVTEEEDAEWFFGTYTDDTGSKQEGIFPRNFVEKYDPPAPPRPSRPTRPKKEAESTSHATTASPPDQAAADTAAAAPRKSADSGTTEISAKPVEPKAPAQELPPATANTAAPLPSPPVEEPVQRAPQPAIQQTEAPKAEKPSKKPPPPAVAEKPTGGSFKDRIAAFNKGSAAPMPFNPGGHQASANHFVKKPFVAPPPSKNAYVPIPAEKPQTIYKREEGQATTEPQAQENVVTERSPVAEPTESGEEDQPKPTSLKERIALLQKQQLEQAARHAEAAQKKEKPKKPQKKKVEQQDVAEQADSSQSPELQKTDTSEANKQTAEAEDQVEESIPHHQRAAPPPIPPPARELTSDTNDADYSGAGDTEEADETSTSKEDLDERSPEPKHQKVPQRVDSDHEDNGNDNGDESGQEVEDEDMDPEIKRRMELRDRMAKISGGMGMMGMFGGPPAGMPGMPAGNYKKPKPPTPGAEASEQASSPTMQAPPVPIMALPGMHSTKSQEPPQSQAKVAEEEDEEVQVADNSPIEAKHATEHSSPDKIPESRPSTSNGTSVPTPAANVNRALPPPPVPDGRPSAPPPPPLESRPVPAPPSQLRTSPGTDDGSDGEIPGPAFSREPKSEAQQESPIDNLPSGKSTEGSQKRASMGHPPPPPPLASPPLPSPAQGRPPPPPPPVPVSRSSTSDSRVSARAPMQSSAHDSEDEVTEYDGDYDTDIASSVKHKDALKAHGRDSSMDEGTITDEVSGQSPKSPVEGRPPIPSTLPPRGVPPPPPNQPPKAVRRSTDMPSMPPPPIPPSKGPQDAGGVEEQEEEDYDPFRHDKRPSMVSRDSDNTKAEASPALGENQFQPSARQSYLSQPPPPPPSQPPRTPGRQSVDLLRGQTGSRRSMDVSRPSMDHGHIASDVDLGEGTLWWAQPKAPPPAFQNRRDILFEIEENSSSETGQTMISKDVYVLFMDYSQTIISVQFDPRNPRDAVLDQRHEPPPPRLRQDQLEDAHTQFGARISEGVAAKQNTVIADGTPHTLVQSLFAPLSDALQPVGVRAYGALVYTNLANASVQQYDEIRPGDIITFRNCRFQGHRGTMHQKYSSEVGKPDHVGVVFDWDGTKKKLRVWEQGRESKKVKMESFKLGDLKSGECRIWRAIPRSSIGWDGGHKA